MYVYNNYNNNYSKKTKQIPIHFLSLYVKSVDSGIIWKSDISLVEQWSK